MVVTNGRLRRHEGLGAFGGAVASELFDFTSLASGRARPPSDTPLLFCYRKKDLLGLKYPSFRCHILRLNLTPDR